MEAIKHEEPALHHEDAADPSPAEKRAAQLRKPRTLADRLAALGTTGSDKAATKRRKTRLTERLATLATREGADEGTTPGPAASSEAAAPAATPTWAAQQSGGEAAPALQGSEPCSAQAAGAGAEVRAGDPAPSQQADDAKPAAALAFTTEPGTAPEAAAAEPATSTGEEPAERRSPRLLRIALPVAAVALTAGAYLAVPSTTWEQFGAWMTGSTPAHTASTMRVVRSRVAAAPAPRPDVAVRHAAEPVSIEIGKAAPLQLGIEKPALLPSNSFVLVRGMPERAMLSRGHPIGAGTWIVKPQELEGLSLTIFAMPVVKPRLAVEVLSEQGDVIGRASTEIAPVMAAGAVKRPASRTASTASTYPPLKAEAVGKASRQGQDERQPARKGRQAERANPPPAKQPVAAALPTVPPASQAQPKAKTAWKMDWGSMATGR